MATSNAAMASKAKAMFSKRLTAFVRRYFPLYRLSICWSFVNALNVCQSAPTSVLTGSLSNVSPMRIIFLL